MEVVARPPHKVHLINSSFQLEQKLFATPKTFTEINFISLLGSTIHPTPVSLEKVQNSLFRNEEINFSGLIGLRVWIATQRKKSCKISSKSFFDHKTSPAPVILFFLLGFGLSVCVEQKFTQLSRKSPRKRRANTFFIHFSFSKLVSERKLSLDLASGYASPPSTPTCSLDAKIYKREC